ncbi:hypothetical protein [Vibrio bathopelagicus]|uniref:hypothetical protein n=1 Tax=Vibrio bathopelagicus TaxID=2777577 RepID=UPI0018653510|nr:hypothetical protein [Vibrio bathopelagicus]
MSLDKFLHKVEHSYTTGDTSKQILAAQILARFQCTKHKVIEGLKSENIDLVITSLECLTLDNQAPIEPIIHCFQYWDYSEIKLAALLAIESNQRSAMATELLVEAICDGNDYWEGDWNDGDDISLIAARILDNHKHKIDRSQADRLLALLKNDPEPDLKSRLISLLSRHSPALLEGSYAPTSMAEVRMFLKSTQDKVMLYKATQHPDLSCQKVAFQRLSEMNCREYLQIFLSGLSYSEPLIRKVSVDQLAKWNYQVDIKHLNWGLLLSGVPLNTLAGLLNERDKLDLINQIQNQQYFPQLTKSIIQLISNLETQHRQPQLNRFLPMFYQIFSGLDEAEQLDCLTTLFETTNEQLSVAFIRQQLHSHTCSNSIKRLLIEHLSLNQNASHQNYLKELTMGTTDIIATEALSKSTPSTEVPLTDTTFNERSVIPDGKPIQVTSTLDALKQASLSTPTAKKSLKKSAKIENLQNQALAIEFCVNKTWLINLCSEDKIDNLTKTAFHALIIALSRHDIHFADIQTQRFSLSVLELVLDEESEDTESIISWLGDDWIQQHRLQLTASPRLSVKVALIQHANDELQLCELFKHPYIGIQNAALNRLRLNNVYSDKKLIHMILEDPLLYPQLALFDINTVYEALGDRLQNAPLTALQAALVFQEATSNNCFSGSEN